MLTSKDYETFLSLLNRIINEDATPWQDKKQALEAECGEGDLINLAELSSWEWE